MLNTILTALILLGLTGLVVGLFIGIASIFFKTEVNQKKEDILSMLPGNNCGGCGYPGCEGMAQAICDGLAPAGGCPVGGKAVADRISEYLGEAPSETVRKVAFVSCLGSERKAKNDYEYVGIKDCKMATVLPGGGPKSCNFGCMGYGTCESVCQFDAIHVKNGIASVDVTKCTGCGQCVKNCPKKIIKLIPYKPIAMVFCSSCDKGPETMKNCKLGCIGCGLCKKECKQGAITIEGGHAIVDPDKCIGCGACVEKCPRRIIGFVNQ